MPPPEESLNAIFAAVDDLAAAKSRLARLQRDGKAAKAYREKDLVEAKSRIFNIEQALAGLMEAAGRRKITTDYGDLALTEAVATVGPDEITLKWAKEFRPDLVETTEKVTLGNLTKHGEWRDGSLEIDGVVVPGIERYTTVRAALPGTRLPNEEPADWNEAGE